jgi:hypothetical protein
MFLPLFVRYITRGAPDLLGGIMSSSKFNGVISAADAAHFAQLLDITTQRLSLQFVPFAQLYAVVPVSNFQVGAVSIGPRSSMKSVQSISSTRKALKAVTLMA